MKTLIKLLIITLLFPFAIEAQHRTCGTADQHSLVERITKNRKFAEENPHLFKSEMPIYIPIRFHMVADFNGEGRAKYAAVLDQICVINSYYNEFDIYFYLDNNGTAENPEYFTWHDQSGVYTDPRTTTSMTYLRQNKDDNAVNIFIIGDAGSSGATTSAGFYTGFGDYIVVQKNQLLDDGTTLAHEIGHFFSLAHPHTGWEDVGWGDANPNIYNPVYPYGTTITFTSISSSQSQPIAVELVNGANCVGAGDRICDTPADYGFGVHQSSCFFNQDVFDRNGDLVRPMEENIMSYFNACDYEFTPDQITAVTADFMSNDRTFLRTGYVPTTGMVSDIPVITEPAQQSTTEFYNSVAIDWDDVPNATGYLLEFNDGSSETFEYLVYESEARIYDLNPNKTYLWFIQAFNESSSCAQSGTQFLFTNDATTGINELDDVEDFRIAPNPASANEGVKLLITMAQNVDAQITLYSTNGTKVYEENKSLSQGNSTVELNNVDFTSGVYFVKIQTENGILSETLIID